MAFEYDRATGALLDASQCEALLALCRPRLRAIVEVAVEKERLRRDGSDAVHQP